MTPQRRLITRVALQGWGSAILRERHPLLQKPRRGRWPQTSLHHRAARTPADSGPRSVDQGWGWDRSPSAEEAPVSQARPAARSPRLSRPVSPSSDPRQTPSLLDTRLPPSPQRVSLLCSEGSGPGPRRPARLLRDTLVPICRFRLQRPGRVLPRAPRLRPLRALSPQHAHAHTQPARQPAWPGASTLGSRRMTGRQGGLGTLLPPSCLPQTSHELLRRAHL